MMIPEQLRWGWSPESDGDCGGYGCEGEVSLGGQTERSHSQCNHSPRHVMEKQRWQTPGLCECSYCWSNSWMKRSCYYNCCYCSYCFHLHLLARCQPSSQHYEERQDLGDPLQLAPRWYHHHSLWCVYYGLEANKNCAMNTLRSQSSYLIPPMKEPNERNT